MKHDTDDCTMHYEVLNQVFKEKTRFDVSNNNLYL